MFHALSKRRQNAIIQQEKAAEQSPEKYYITDTDNNDESMETEPRVSSVKNPFSQNDFSVVDERGDVNVSVACCFLKSKLKYEKKIIKLTLFLICYKNACRF